MRSAVRDAGQKRSPRLTAQAVCLKSPPSLVSSDGNRCTRNCYNCPLCTSPLSVSALGSSDGAEQAYGPYCLVCSYCDWSTLDLGLSLSAPNKITEQLSQLEKERHSAPPQGLADQSLPTSRAAVFSRLLTFYQGQLAQSENLYPDSGHGSPRSFARIMQIYDPSSPATLKKARERPRPMKDATTLSEGLVVVSQDQDQFPVQKLAEAETATLEQRDSHPWNRDARFTSDLWPVPVLLKTKRGKRCKTCRHILIKLDDRHTSVKYKIRLLAQNHIPKLALSVFNPTVASTPPSTAINFALTSTTFAAARDSEEYNLTPRKPVQYLLTLTNPLFDPVRVTLATPAITPGPIASRVTILCPSFEIGPDGDMWDEALGLSSSASSTTDASQGYSKTITSNAAGGEARQPEAGKIWEKGRNWVRVVVEVVPGSLTRPDASSESGSRHGILEIPIHVRVEWEAEVTASEAGLSTPTPGSKAVKESREVAFWSVLGAGKIIE